MMRFMASKVFSDSPILAEFLGRGCDEALVSEKKGVRISTGKAIQ